MLCLHKPLVIIIKYLYTFCGNLYNKHKKLGDMMNKLMGVKEVAISLKISEQRVLQLIKTNIIPADTVSSVYVIREENISGIKWDRKPGKKAKAKTCPTCGSNMICPTCHKPVETVCVLCGKPTMAEDSLCDECRE